MKPKSFNINFDLGLNTKDSPKKIKDGECSICQDVYLDQSGSILTRRFKNIHIPYNSKIKTIFPYGNLFVHILGGNIYNGINLIGSGYGNDRFSCAEYNEVLYAVNGINKLRYNGINIYNIGVTKPTIAPFISDQGGAGNPSGAYNYKYRYLDQYGLTSTFSPISNDLTVDTNKVNILLTPSSAERVTYIEIYRLGGTLTDWYFVDKVLNSTAIAGASLTFVDADDQGENYYDVYKYGNFILAACGANGLRTYSVSAAGVLAFIDADDQGNTYYGVWADDNFIYAACGDGGLRTYTVDSSGVLTFIDADLQVGGDYRQVWSDGKFIYVADIVNGLLSYSVNNAGVLTYINSSSGASVYDVYGDGRFIYGACGVDGLRSYTVDNSGMLSFVNVDNNADSAISVFCNNNFVLICGDFEGDALVYSYRVNDLGSFTLIDVQDLGVANNSGIWANDNNVYAGGLSDGLFYLSINANGIFTLIDSDFQAGGSSVGVFGDESFIYVAHSGGGLLSYLNGYTYIDNVADSSIVTIQDSDNNDQPSNGLKFITEHYQRFIGAKTTDYPNSIEFTREFYPESWGNSLNQQYLLGGSDECTGLMSWGRFIVFFKKNQIYVMEGSDPTEWHRRKSDARKGNISPYAIDFWKLPIFCDYSGLSVFDGNLDTKISDKVDPWFYDNRAYLPDAVGFVHEDKYYFGIDNNETLVYDLRTGTFIIYKYGLTAIAHSINENIFFGGVGNNVVRLEEENNDNYSDTVYFKIKSKAYPLHDVEGRLGELKDYIIQLDTKSEDVTFNIYIDDELKETKTLNTDHMLPVSGTFNALSGYYAEFEFVYTGTKMIQLDVPVIINQTRIEATNA